MVRAKFYCTEVQPQSDQDGYSINLSPVISGSAENKEFYKWTPGGSISLSIVNKAAALQFEVGKNYYVDFTPEE